MSVLTKKLSLSSKICYIEHFLANLSNLYFIVKINFTFLKYEFTLNLREKHLNKLWSLSDKRAKLDIRSTKEVLIIEKVSFAKFFSAFNFASTFCWVTLESFFNRNWFKKTSLEVTVMKYCLKLWICMKHVSLVVGVLECCLTPSLERNDTTPGFYL